MDLLSEYSKGNIVHHYKNRKKKSYISAEPKLINKGAELTANLWKRSGSTSSGASHTKSEDQNWIQKNIYNVSDECALQWSYCISSSPKYANWLWMNGEWYARGAVKSHVGFKTILIHLASEPDTRRTVAAGHQELAT